MAEPKENEPTPAGGADPGAPPRGQQPEAAGAPAPAAEPKGEQPGKPPKQEKRDKQQ